jgi:hypothetical protein
VVLPPHRTIRWDLVLSPELVRALDGNNIVAALAVDRQPR